LSQLEIWVIIAQSALNYIFIQIVSGGNQRAIIKDVKTDLRTTKEDLLSELKDSRESLLRDNGTSTQAIIDILTAELNKRGKNGNS
jgi:hypothetical protein